MKKIKISISILFAILLVLNGCESEKDFFDIKPKGSLSEDVLANEKGINTLLIGAYSMVDGVSGYDFDLNVSSINWVWGDVRAVIANKGTDAGDASGLNPIQRFEETASNSYVNNKWQVYYDGISRANAVITVTNKALEAGSITQDQADLFINQCRALRGFFHMELVNNFGMVVYIDENTDHSALTNTEDISDKIIADFTAGTNLPQNMTDIGRWNKTISQVWLAKAQMQYKHDYATAKTILQDVITNGKKPNGGAIGLATTYGEIFDIVERNGIESVYTVQASVNDGSGGLNGAHGALLNFPYKGGASPGGCCGFFQPTQEYVNSFRTDANGLPLPDYTYNNDPVKNDQGIKASDPFTPDEGNLDPRLDWSVGRRGIPYWDWGPHTGADWIRDQSYAGPYSPKKQVYKKSQEGVYTEVGGWTSGWTANGYRMIRYAEVLLLMAECQIETGDLPGAMANINLIRDRAANPDGFVKNDDGTPAANYKIGLYTSFADKDAATYALRMERKLELGMEGKRFYDLKRWGTAITETSRALTYEKTMPWGSSLYGNATVGPEDLNLPIPQRQIDLSNGMLVQNR